MLTRDRLSQVRKTQKAIMYVLTERYYAWEDARKLAERDPEITFKKNGKVSVNSAYFNE